MKKKAALNASPQPQPKQRRRQPLSIVLLLLLIPLAAYLWWRPMREEYNLENASVQTLRKITSERPGYARAFYYLGLRLKRAHQLAPAFDALSHAAELDPDDEAVWVAAARTANDLYGPEASLRLVDEFFRRHPDSARIKAQRTALLTSLQHTADGLAAAKHNKEAIRYYRIWLGEEPTASNAQQGLIKALQAEGNDEQTFLTLDSMLQQNPKFVEARIVMADLFFAAGFHKEARRYLKEAVKQAPDNAQAWHALGRICSGSDPDVAENAFQKAVDLAPDSAVARLDLAEIQVARHKPDQAEQSYRKALQLAPKDPVVLAQIGGFLVEQHPDAAHLAEAEKIARQALALDPKNGDALYVLGQVALDRREAGPAVASLQKAVSSPLMAEAGAVWYMLSRAYTLQGDRAKAGAARQKSEQIHAAQFALARTEEEAYAHPQDPALRLKVARLYAQHGAYMQAISQYQGCLTLDPNNVTARNELEALTARLKSIGKLPSMTLFQAMVAASARLH